MSINTPINSYKLLMDGFWCVFLFILSFFLILKGGKLLVESSVWFAVKSKIPPIVVGATIVSIATTFPETSVAIFAGLSGSESVAVNTAIGSMMCNFALVLGISFFLLPTVVNKSNFLTKLIYFLVVIILFFLITLDGVVSVVDSVILFVMFLVFMATNFIEAKNIGECDNQLKKVNVGWARIVIQLLVSSFAIGYGANIIVQNVDKLSEMLNISEGLVGLLIISIGTNIPELVTTISAIKLKTSEIGIGNIFGASIIDATLLIPVTVLSSPNKSVLISNAMLFLTVPMLILICFIIVVPIFKRGKSSRLQGLVLMTLFILYLTIMSKIS